MNLRDLLLDSCEYMYQQSANCTNDFIANNSSSTTHAASCSWYHSVWQYLRILDCVSAPQWHQSFYEAAINKAIPKNKKIISILISGTADYSLLYLVINVLNRDDLFLKKVNIDIVDLCGTPLRICDWYIKKAQTSKEYDFSKISVSYHKSNIGLFDCGRKYDIICTDAFLTRFSLRETPSIISKWYNLLCIGGKIITTVRIHDSSNESPSIVGKIKEISIFIAKVQERFKQLPEHEAKKMHISLDNLSFLAFRYIIRMKSNFLGSESEIMSLFEKGRIKIITEMTQVATVPGEIRETKYFRLVAQRED